MAKGKPVEAWAPKNPLGHLMLWAIAYRALDARAPNSSRHSATSASHGRSSTAAAGASSVWPCRRLGDGSEAGVSILHPLRLLS